MRPIFHLLTGEFPPGRGGVGDYTHLLANALAARGCDVHVWCPSQRRSARDAPEGQAPEGPGPEGCRPEGCEPEGCENVQVHTLPDAFGPASRRALEPALAERPGCVLLQYVPNALGARGANLPFCFWLRGLRRRGMDVRVMFHEPYFYFAWQHPLRNVLAATQRLMARVLLDASRIVYLSTETWVRYLRPYARRRTEMVVLPIPSTIPIGTDSDATLRWRVRFGAAPIVGHFGTFGDHLARELRAAIPAILGADPRVRFVCIGAGSETFAALMAGTHPALAERIVASGALASGEVASALRACDLVVQPYPDGVTTRRTSVMAGLANHVATVTTDGFLTEPVWSTTGAVALVAASDADALAAKTIALLRDDRGRSALAETGQRVYEGHFAIGRTIDRLIDTENTASLPNGQGQISERVMKK